MSPHSASFLAITLALVCGVEGMPGALDTPSDAFWADSKSDIMAQTDNLERMMDDERAIMSSPDPVEMDAQGAAATFHVGESLNLGEGQSVKDMAGSMPSKVALRHSVATLGDPAKPSAGVEYKVSASTGQQPDADTKAPILIAIIGSKGSTGNLLLSKAGISSSAKDFTVRSEVDVGEIMGVQLRNSDEDVWYCTGLSVSPATSGATATQFSVGSWLGAPYQESAFVVRDIEYKVTVKTASEEGASTTGKQFITLFGESSSTPKLQLTTGGFQSGAAKTVALKARDVGRVTKIRLESDSADYWLCDTIEVLVGGSADAFSVGKWIGFPSATVVSASVDADYKILIRTGSVDDKVLGDSGTKGQVYVTLYGSLGATRKRPLKTGFEEGKDTTISMRAKDVGTIEQIKLSSESKDNWLCDAIQIQKGAQNAIFSIGQWVGSPSMTPLFVQKDAEYALKVVTGDLDDADTAGEVFITIFGVDGATDKKSLSAKGIKKGSFEVILVAANVGAITKLRIDSASTDNWFCESVKITKDGQESRFMIGSWVVSPVASFVEKNVAVKYVLSVKTGMDFNAPTVSKPLVSFVGEKGETQKQPLDGEFKMGQLDVISIWATNVGTIRQLKLQSTSKDDWLCQYVHVSDAKKTTRFTVDKWLASPLSASMVLHADVPYLVNACTGGLTGAGTSSTVYVDILGSLGVVHRQPLKTKMRRGRCSRVKVVSTDVGTITSIRLSTDSIDDWFCKSVSISVGHRDTAFTVNRWLSGQAVPQIHVNRDVQYVVSWLTDSDKQAGTIGTPTVTVYGTKAKFALRLRGSFVPAQKSSMAVIAADVGAIKVIKIKNDQTDSWVAKRISIKKMKSKALQFVVDKPVNSSKPVRILAPGELPAQHKVISADDDKATYELTVDTGEHLNAETSGSQYISFVGEDGHTKFTLLGKAFPRGSTETVKLNLPNVGKLLSIRLSTDSDDGWFCEKLSVTLGEKKSTFVVNNWLSGNGQMLSHLTIPASLTYRITVETGKSEKAGTNSVPSLTMFGDEGMSAAVQLMKVKDAGAGSKVEITTQQPDVGALTNLQLSTKSVDNWQCKSITIVKDKEKPVTFTVKQWLGLPRQGTIQAVQNIEYTIIMNTGTREDADTKGVVFIMLHGKDRSSGMQKLTDGFEKSSKKKVVLIAPDVGTLHKVTLHTKSPDGWFCKSVSVQVPGVDKESVFEFERWIQHPESPTVHAAESVDYKLKIQTGNLPDSGSEEGQFFIKMFGDNGETNSLPLSTGFKKGESIDKTITTADVGSLDKIQLQTGSTDGWLAESLEISKGGKRFVFPANSWIQKPGKVAVDVLAGVRYNFVFKTSSLADAGTKGQVHVKLIGSKSSTSEMLAIKDVSAGSAQSLTLTSRNVGKIKSLQIKMDDKDNWFCESVSVAVKNQKSMFFRVNKYFSAPHLSSVLVHADCEYIFTISTGASARSGSTGALSAQVVGHLGATRWLHLKTGFEAGSESTVRLHAADVGRVITVNMKTADQDDVELAQLGLQVIDVQGDSIHYKFGTSKWLKAPLFSDVSLFTQKNYAVTVNTKSPADSGMSASAFITIFGAEGATKAHILSAPFLPGSTRKYSFLQEPVDEITSVRLHSFGSEAWKPEVVTVETTHVLTGTRVTVLPFTNVVSMETGAVDAAVSMKYLLIKSHAITGAAQKASILKEVKYATPAGCMLSCGKEEKCNSLLFNEESQLCVMLSADRGVGFDFNLQGGTNYYEKVAAAAAKKDKKDVAKRSDQHFEVQMLDQSHDT